MYLFKTSGSTIRRVVRHQKHAFFNKPKDWFVGEAVVISKNVADLTFFEKQIQFVGKIGNIRKTSQKNFEEYWPGNIGRWNYLVDLVDLEKIQQPFDLIDFLPEENISRYINARSFCRLSLIDERLISQYLLNQ